MHRTWAVAVCVLLTVTGALAQGAQPAPVNERDLIMDVQTLVRLAPLKLTDAQVDALLKAYADLNAGANTLDPKTIEQLVGLKQRLLLGTVPGEGELDALRALGKGGDGRGFRAEVTADPAAMMEKLRAILTAEQLDKLAFPEGHMVAQPTERGFAQTVLGRLTRAIAVPDADWPQVRAAVVEGLTVTLYDAAQNRKAADELAPYLDRLRKMTLADLGAQQEKLGAEISALLPGGVPLDWEVPQAADQPRGGARDGGKEAGRRPLEGGRAQGMKGVAIFMQPNTSRLLAEIKAARAK